MSGELRRFGGLARLDGDQGGETACAALDTPDGATASAAEGVPAAVRGRAPAAMWASRNAATAWLEKALTARIATWPMRVRVPLAGDDAQVCLRSAAWFLSPPRYTSPPPLPARGVVVARAPAMRSVRSVMAWRSRLAVPGRRIAQAQPAAELDRRDRLLVLLSGASRGTKWSRQLVSPSRCPRDDQRRPQRVQPTRRP